MRLLKATLKTGGKTNEEILNDFDGDADDEQVKNWKRAYNLVDGLEVIVSHNVLFEQDYSLISWYKDDDLIWKEFVYQLEQDEYFGQYIDDRETFNKDWDSEDYSPTGVIVFEEKDVKITETIKQEESK